MGNLILKATAICLVFLPGSGFAQSTAQSADPTPPLKPDPPKPATPDIIVTAERLPGSVITDVLPIQVLSPADVAAYGASSLADLLDQLSPKTKSKSARANAGPVLLVNGRRISNPADMAALPPEALLRVEIYPEKVAVEQGFSADQRVVNIVLQRTYSATTVEVGTGGSTANSLGEQSADASLFQLDGDSRLTLSARYARKSAVLARQRGILSVGDLPLSLRGVVTGVASAEIDPALSLLAGRIVTQVEVPENGRSLAAFADPARQIIPGLDDGRTIIPSFQSAGINGSFARPVGKETNFALSFGSSFSTTRDILGLSPISLLVSPIATASPFLRPVLLTRVFDPIPLSSEAKSKSANVGISLNGKLREWSWSTDAKWARSISTYAAGRGFNAFALQRGVDEGVDPFAMPLNSLALPSDESSYVSQFISFETSASGPLFALPAGKVRAFIQFGGDREDVSGSSYLDNVGGLINLSRRKLAAATTIEVPIASREKNILSPLGDLSIAARVANRWFSDAGELPNWTFVVNWSPIKRFSVSSTWIGQQDAATLSQLGAPARTTPFRVVYDFVRGETTFASIISGGNPNLLPERRRDFKLQLNWKPLEKSDLNLQILYANVRATNSPIAAPLFTPAVEAALPGRVVRGGDGRIISIDQRDVNVAAERGEQINWSLNYAKRFGTAAASGNWSANFAYRMRIRDDRQIQAGLPVLNFHKGAAFNYLGGVPVNEIEASGSWYRAGKGLSFNSTWRDATAVFDRSTPQSTRVSRLDFSPLFTLNLPVFFNLDQFAKIMQKAPFLKAGRISLKVNNLLGNAIEVRNERRLIPPSYQRGYLDPSGRTFEVSFRKQF
jgi:iron complex outermembrane recepter protein